MSCKQCQGQGQHWTYDTDEERLANYSMYIKSGQLAIFVVINEVCVCVWEYKSEANF